MREFRSSEAMRDASDYERKRLRESSACAGCGSPDPVRVEGSRCSDCYDGWPRCDGCRRWLDLKGWGEVASATFPDGTFCAVCRPQLRLEV